MGQGSGTILRATLIVLLISHGLDGNQRENSNLNSSSDLTNSVFMSGLMDSIVAVALR